MGMANAPIHDFWWESDKRKAHEPLNALLEYLTDNQRHSETDALRHMRLYGNLDMGIGPYRYNRSQSNLAVNRVTLNVIKSCVDTLTSKIAKNKPRPLFLTSGGDFSAQRRGKLLTKFCDGVFYATNAYQQGQLCFLDAAVLGTGVMAVYEKNGKPELERVFPPEIVVDEAEAINGKPGNMYRRKFLPRTVVLRMFKDATPAIRAAILSAKEIDPIASQQNVADLIEVREAWHLASKRGEDDGRHVVVIENATLLDETYDKDYFPFVFLRLNPKLLGFWGCGIAEQLVGIQLEINKLLKNITAQMHLLSAPKILVEAGSKIVSSHLTNEIGSILNYVGQKPELWVPDTVSPEMFQHLERLVRYAYETTGISQLSASSQKPAGVESGAGLREMNEIESERFVVVGQAYERFFVEIAQQVIWCAHDINAAAVDSEDEEGGYKVRLMSKRYFNTVFWDDIALEEDEYVMQIWPVSQLPQTPSGRLEAVQEMSDAGYIGPEDAIKLLDYPDLEQVNNMLTAAVEDLDMCIEEMLDKGDYNPPEPMQNLELGLKRFQSAYLRARIDKAPEERLELLRRWMQDAKAMLDMANQAAGGPGADGSVQPEAQEGMAIPGNMQDPAVAAAAAAGGAAAPQPLAPPAV